MEKVGLKHKEELFNQLFELKKVSYPRSKNNKTTDTYIYCNDSYLSTYFNGVINKFGRGKLKQSDLWSVIISFSYKAIIQSDLEEDFNKLSEHEKNKLRKYIKKNVYYGIKEKSNPDSKKMTIKVNGVRKSVPVDMNVSSLDKLVSGDDSETALINLLEADSSIFSGNRELSYQMNKFIVWFDENKEEVLTQSQNNFLQDLLLIKELDNPKPEEIKELTGTESHQVNQKLKRIEKRILTAWRKESEEKKLSVKTKQLTKEINKVNEFFKILNEDESEKVNYNLSEWVKENFNQIDNLLYKDLEVGQCISITQLENGSLEELEKPTLYKVIDTLSNHLESLEDALRRSENHTPLRLTGSISIVDEVPESKVYILSTDGSIRPKENV